MEGFGGPVSLSFTLPLCACPHLTLVSGAEEMWGERGRFLHNGFIRVQL